LIGTSKTVATTAIVGLLATTAAEPLISSDMPWFAQFGLCGLFGFLLWWNMERGDKRTAKGIDDLKDEIGGMRSDLTSGQDKTNSLLSQALFESRQK
jgi:hypothetical protein